MIIDPENDNNAIDQNGELVHAVRFIPSVENLAAPTTEELSQGQIVGYGKITFGGDDD